jgi:hypothetical protein
MPDGCSFQGGLTDAFQPITSLPYGLAEWMGCSVFNTRYPIMVQNIARALGNLRDGSKYFSGHVILMTSPPHAQNCEHATTPNQMPPPSAEDTDVTKEAHYFRHVRYAETIWWSAFQKWAPHLKLSVLNVTHLSETRADARVPGDCGHFCYPGLPHIWAEMLLRLLEQHHFNV